MESRAAGAPAEGMQEPSGHLGAGRCAIPFFALAPSNAASLYSRCSHFATRLAQPFAVEIAAVRPVWASSGASAGTLQQKAQRLHPRLRLSATNLVVRRGTRLVIDKLSFEAGSGEALLLTGPNGSGKTTLLRSIAGFLAVEAGQIELDGAGSDREIGEMSHYVGHANGIKSGLTAGENLNFWCQYLGGAGSRLAVGERVFDALERLRLSSLEDIPAAYLSAGQKRRLGLGRLLVADRPIWLLDEPTVSLDSASVALLAGIVQDHVAGGGLVMAATHLPLGLGTARELRLGVREAAS